MSALVFCSANRSHLKFKFEFESKEFKFLKYLINGKAILYFPLIWPWVRILAEAQPPGGMAQIAYQARPTSKCASDRKS
jgi:predicted nucleic acid binding AN1-type Zn finger protein